MYVNPAYFAIPILNLVMVCKEQLKSMTCALSVAVDIVDNPSH